MPLNDNAINEILPFALEGDINSGDLMPLEEYKSDSMRKRGHQVGLAKRELINRAHRQANFIAAGVAQFLANNGHNVHDNGNLDEIEIGLLKAIEAIFKNQPTLLYPSAFVTLYEQSPPLGFYVRNGGIITNADTTVPKLWEALQKPENAWKCKTQAQWTALSNATPWSGIGGVPFFVVDTSTKTIRLPDTRGMHEEGSGFDSLIVGGVKKDMVRNMTGAINSFYTTAPWNASSVGILKYGRNDFAGVLNTTAVNAKSDLSIDISLQVPTGPVNRPRSFGVLHCVYAGI